VKLALIRTASQIPGVEVDRQGWGVVNPRRAVAEALAMSSSNDRLEFDTRS
jgi:hypothetical protein